MKGGKIRGRKEKDPRIAFFRIFLSFFDMRNGPFFSKIAILRTSARFPYLPQSNRPICLNRLWQLGKSIRAIRHGYPAWRSHVARKSPHVVCVRAGTFFCACLLVDRLVELAFLLEDPVVLLLVVGGLGLPVELRVRRHLLVDQDGVLDEERVVGDYGQVREHG